MRNVSVGRFGESRPLSLVLVDDHALFREALRPLLKVADPLIDVVGEAADERGALEAAGKTRPDVILMDVVLNGTSGVTLTRQLRLAGFEGRVLMLTAVSEVSFILDALAAGAQGYALKEQRLAEVVAAIRCVFDGRQYLAPRLEEAVAEAHARTTAAGWGVMDTLSTREREIFSLVTAGYTNERMASALYLSVRTIENHRSRINRKLSAHPGTQRLAAPHGLVTA
jgi:two-component system, NarL family, response regulator NreC